MVHLTEQVFAWIAAGEFDRLGAVMHAVTADEDPRIFLASAWRAIQSDLGALERLSASHVELPGGTTVDESAYLSGTVVGVTAIRCEEGSLEGRVAVTEDLKVIGILMVPPKHGRLPF